MTHSASSTGRGGRCTRCRRDSSRSRRLRRSRRRRWGRSSLGPSSPRAGRPYRSRPPVCRPAGHTARAHTAGRRTKRRFRYKYTSKNIPLLLPRRAPSLLERAACIRRRRELHCFYLFSLSVCISVCTYVTFGRLQCEEAKIGRRGDANNENEAYLDMHVPRVVYLERSKLTQFSSGHPKPRLEDGASLCTWQSAISGTQISPPPLLPSSPLSPPRVSGPLPSPCFVWFDWRSLRFSADRSARSHELVFFVVLKRLVFGRSRMNWSLWYGEDWWSLVHVCVSLPSLCVSIANRVRTSSRKTRCDWSAPAAVPDACRGIGLGQGQREQFLRKVGGDVGIEYETGHNGFQSAFVPCGLS